jgi:hypothetical protein
MHIDPKKMKLVSGRQNCTSMFIRTVFTTVKIWNELKCPLLDE